MKMPLGWAKEFADITCTPQEYADRMTMSGSKVECFESEADSISNVVVGRILRSCLTRIPTTWWSARWRWAPNARCRSSPARTISRWATLCPPPCTNLPARRVKITKGKLRGVESCGMLCSLSELGLTTHDFPHAVEDGILVLDEEWARHPAVQALGLDDDR